MLTDQLTDRRAVVCGSTQGIGRAVAELLAARGAHVTLIARNEEALREVAAALPAAHGQQHDYLVADFSRPAELAERLAAYVAKSPAVHILVNNTGGPAGGPLLNASIDDLRAALEQHLICNHLLAQALVPGMRATGYGRIINVISTSVKQPLPNLGVSNTTRGAVASWAKTLANELGPSGITVNNVLPGATLTQRHHSLLAARSASTGASVDELEALMLKQIPTGRFGEAEEVAAAVAYLASPLASYVNGINLPVDGGRMSSL